MDNQNGFSAICSKCGRTLREGEMLNISGQYVCEPCASSHIFAKKPATTVIRKRMPSSFFHFCFSFLPGAGHMYLGLMKMGLFRMCTFFLSIYLTPLSPTFFGLTIPIIWFYSFFDSLALKRKICNGEYVEDRFFEKNSFFDRYKGIIIFVLLLLVSFGSFFSQFSVYHHRGGGVSFFTSAILIGLGIALLYKALKKKGSPKTYNTEDFGEDN